MYSGHLRDMYNFDPSAVETFLKEMRVLAAQGQSVAQAMRSKVLSLPDIDKEKGGAATSKPNGSAGGAENAAAQDSGEQSGDATENGRREDSSSAGDRQKEEAPRQAKPPHKSQLGLTQLQQTCAWRQHRASQSTHATRVK